MAVGSEKKGQIIDLIIDLIVDLHIDLIRI